jgi:CheY-like chemotaxis protein
MSWRIDMQDLGASGKRLLVAEDDPTGLIVISHFIESFGYEFDIVENGLDCLKLLSENSYDLVLTDISMPRMDGVQVAKKIREMANPNCNIPIVAMTANAELVAAERFVASGICEVLPKPFRKVDLQLCIEKWL